MKPSLSPLEGRVSRTADRDKLAAAVGAWKAAGASHLSVNTMKAGFASVDEHLAALEQAATDLT